jgi:hypothetical protein
LFSCLAWTIVNDVAAKCWYKTFGPGKTREQLRVNWEKLIQYVGITYVQDIKIELITRKRVVIPVPKYPAKALSDYNRAEAKRISNLNISISDYQSLMDFNISKANRPGLSEDESAVITTNRVNIRDKHSFLTGFLTAYQKSEMSL